MSHSQHLWQALERLTTVAMLVASGAVTWMALSRTYTPAATGVTEPNGEVLEGTLSPELLTTSAVRGMAEAELAIVEFSDYQCPFCGRNARDVYPQLQRDLVDTGKVKYIFLNFPLEQIHPYAFKAAEAAECSRRQGKYWEMHDRLFANQQALGRTDLFRYAEDSGVSPGGFEACLNGEMESKIKADISLANSFQINSTPTFLFGKILPDGAIELRRKLHGAIPYSTFKAVLDELRD